MQNTYPAKFTIRFASIIVNTLTNIYNWFTRNISASWLLILLFAYTAFSKAQLFKGNKIIDVSQFKDAMLKSPLLQHHVNVLAYTVPSVELVICLLLLFKPTKLIGYYASLALLCLFTGYIVYMFIWAPALPCTCGGVIAELSWHQHLALNVAFIIITTNAIVLTHKRKKELH